MVVRWIMHVDMDAFYASIEQRDNPALQGLPVIVGGLSERGVVATASYEARKFGVHSAMSIKQAHSLCPEGVYVAPRMSHYKEISHQIRTIMYRYSPDIEPLALDEAFLDISGMERQYPSVEAIGRAIKDDIKKETGLIASAGIAPNKFLAKLGSDLKKPDGLVWIPYGQEIKVLAPLPVSRLWGVGKVTAQALVRAGYKRIGDIAAAGPEKLRPIVGNQAQRLYELSLGQDDRPLEISRKAQSIGNECTYAHDLTAAADIDAQFRILANQVSWRLRQQHLMGRTFTLKVRFGSFQTITRSITVDDGIYSEEQLYFFAKKLYNRERIKDPIRLLGVTVSQLMPVCVQGNLFSDDREAQDKVAVTLDRLQERFGKDAIMKGFLWEKHYHKDK